MRRRLESMAFGAAICVVACSGTSSPERVPDPAETSSEAKVDTSDWDVVRKRCLGDLEACVVKCEAGDGAMCGEAADAYAAGQGTAQDLERGKRLAVRGCDLNNVKACFTAGLLFLGFTGSNSELAPSDGPKAVAHLDKACTLDISSWACDFLTSALLIGDIVPQDASKAVTMLERQCANTESSINEYDCVRLADLIYYGDYGVKRNEARALQLYQEACTLTKDGTKVDRACLQLGLMSLEGRLVKKDEVRAGQYFQGGCVQSGSPEACDKLGDLILAGKLPKQQASEAREHLATMCRLQPDDLGGAESCLISGDLVEHDNSAEARRLWGLAAENHKAGCQKAITTKKKPFETYLRGQGRAEHCAAMGHLARTGKAVPKNLEASFSYYDMACTEKSAAGCFGAGMLAREGQGTTRDSTKARGYFTRACNLGHHEGCVQVAATK